MKTETSSKRKAANDGNTMFPAAAVHQVRFYPKDVDETFYGTVIEETQYSYLVIPDDNLTGTARWNKKCCDVLR